MSLVEKIRSQLVSGLEALHVDIEDDSLRHAGHQAMAGVVPEATHLNILVVSPRFEGLGVLEQHRLVNRILQEARDTHLHALQLKTMTPTQWQAKVSS